VSKKLGARQKVRANGGFGQERAVLTQEPLAASRP